ncbi:aldehyde dehydrogenase family protein [Legionella sp. W05-934-2]|jgi:acyl-CoA reductase-like NAD-dependent aldehyde dehydrogenase|uniref:aldehyde dehydrogenase family protein n=1 Tax=Legionella sp. W05-934-2 TaxID=1198649 RepID=UPI0034630ADF
MKSTLQVISPIDQSIYVERPYASEQDISTCLELSHAVQNRWKQTALNVRKALCRAAVFNLLSQRQAIASELSWQMGRPIAYAGNELDGLAERAHYMIDIADTALANIQVPPKTGFKRFIKREPLGTCFIIAPWNYPYLTAVNGIIPALLAGNTVILKHSAQTPLVAERFFQAFTEAGLPEGVFQFMNLSHTHTEQVIQSDLINQVVFTGSVSGGKQVEKAALGRFIPICLELGGKDPAYVRADAKLDYAVATTMDGAFFNSGQSCCGIERIYVHRACFDEFIHQSKLLVNQYRLGPADDPSVTLGPMVSAQAADFVRKQIQEAIKSGATPLIDPTHFDHDKPGTAYLAPQILVNINHQMRIMQEETFGPVVCVMAVDSDEEAIYLMNDSQYGLTASVFSEDIDAAVAIGEQVQTGTFFVNRCDYLDPALAWTGVKDSGRGCSLSELGFATFTQPKSFHIKQLSK